jgi:hypothetical protein
MSIVSIKDRKSRIIKVIPLKKALENHLNISVLVVHLGAGGI